MLFVVPTPIGNLNDISPRALETLKDADIIACEDTRQTMKLLNHYAIKNKLVSYHQHSKLSKVDYLISELKDAKNIALVSDAGTPAISDPGYMLISQAIENNIEVISIPGPSAVITALAGSGYGLTSFTYLGFFPQKKGRQTLLKKIKAEKQVFCFYESKHRIIKLLNELIEYMPERNITLARELSKMHEEFLRGTPESILKILEDNPKKQKGEFVVIINSK